jgi:hypothetical protein
MAKELHLTSKMLKGQYETEIMKCHLGGAYEACSEIPEVASRSSCVSVK